MPTLKNGGDDDKFLQQWENLGRKLEVEYIIGVAEGSDLGREIVFEYLSCQTVSGGLTI